MCTKQPSLWKVVWSYLKKLKMEQPYDPAIPLLGIYLKKPKTLIWKSIRTSAFIAVLFIIIYNSQDLEAAPVPISGRVDKKAAIYLHNGILLRLKKNKQTT